MQLGSGATGEKQHRQGAVSQGWVIIAGKEQSPQGVASPGRVVAHHWGRLSPATGKGPRCWGAGSTPEQPPELGASSAIGNRPHRQGLASLGRVVAGSREGALPIARKGSCHWGVASLGRIITHLGSLLSWSGLTARKWPRCRKRASLPGRGHAPAEWLRLWEWPHRVGPSLVVGKRPRLPSGRGLTARKQCRRGAAALPGSGA